MGFLRFGKFAFLQQIVNSAAYGCFIAIQRGSNLYSKKPKKSTIAVCIVKNNKSG